MNDEHGSATKAPRVSTRVNVRAGRSLLPGPATPRAAAAPRQLQTRWLLIVAVLVLLGGVVLMYAVPRYTQHTSVVVMARDVTMGAALTAADVTTADVAVGPLVAVVHPQDGPVLGQTALSDLLAGAVLSPRQIGPAPVLAAGQDLVPVRLKLGQRPQQGLSPGQRVLAVPAPADPGSPAGQSLLATAPIRATVVSSGDPDPASGDVVVDLQVPEKVAVALARTAATGSMTLLVVAGGSGP